MGCMEKERRDTSTAYWLLMKHQSEILWFEVCDHWNELRVQTSLFVWQLLCNRPDYHLELVVTLMHEEIQLHGAFDPLPKTSSCASVSTAGTVWAALGSGDETFDRGTKKDWGGEALRCHGNIAKTESNTESETCIYWGSWDIITAKLHSNHHIQHIQDSS